jgi:hypothetical protein
MKTYKIENVTVETKEIFRELPIDDLLNTQENLAFLLNKVTKEIKARQEEPTQEIPDFENFWNSEMGKAYMSAKNDEAIQALYDSGKITVLPKEFISQIEGDYCLISGNNEVVTIARSEISEQQQQLINDVTELYKATQFDFTKDQNLGKGE